MLVIQNLVSGILLSCIYMMIAIGLTTIYGIFRILHVAHGAVYAIGGYVTVLLILLTNLPLLFSGIIGTIGSAMLGLLFYYAVYKKLLQNPVAALMASIGLLVMFEDLYRLIAGPYRIPFRSSVFTEIYLSGPVTLTGSQIIILLVTSAALFAIWVILEKTKLGIGLKAVSQDLPMASALGINANLMVMVAFLLGSALAGLGGLMYAVYYHEIFPTMGSETVTRGLAIIVFGGFGSIRGAVVASLIFGLFETFMASTVGFPLPREAIAFILMIAMLIVRPYGLFGKE